MLSEGFAPSEREKNLNQVVNLAPYLICGIVAPEISTIQGHIFVRREALSVVAWFLKNS